MIWQIRPVYLALALALVAATVIAAAADVSVLVIYAGSFLAIATVVLGWDDREYQQRRRR